MCGVVCSAPKSFPLLGLACAPALCISATPDAGAQCSWKHGGASLPDPFPPLVVVRPCLPRDSTAFVLDTVLRWNLECL